MLTVAFAADDPRVPGRFWAQLLDRVAVEDAGGVLLPGEGGQVALRFFPTAVPRSRPNRTHLHVTSKSIADQERTVARALDLGGRHADVGQLPDEEHVVLADPEGNAFCVLEPDNSFVAGCGFLGEVACDGTRDVGLFWSRALGWPLVWDENEETAIQSPEGGTKIAWGGPPVSPPDGRQRFELTVTATLEAEIARLVALGATRHDNAANGAALLTDPDGFAFHLQPR